MKLIISLAFLLTSLLSISQTKKSGFIFIENGVNRLKPNSSYLSSYVDNYKIPKENFNLVQFPKNATNSFYRNDTLVSQYHSNGSIEISPIDFRTLSIGYGRIISSKKRIRIDHVVGFQYSSAEFLIGTLATNYTEKQNLWVDVNNRSRITYITTSNSVIGYGKMKSMGIIYQNTATLKISKRLDLSFAIRQNLLIKTKDQLMLIQTETHDTSNNYPYYDMENCGGMGIGVMFSDIDFYSKQQPPNNNYKTFNGKTGLQYQMTCFAKLSLSLCKKLGTKLYTQIGASPINFYGKQHKVNSALNYGIGISQDLSF